MAKRYNVSEKSLDLSRFHTDPDLIDDYVAALALFRPSLMFTAFDIIVENYPELAALNLSDNKLYSLHKISELLIKLPKLKALHTGRNNLQIINQLDCLQGLHLEDLVLDGNPLCNKYKDHSTYVCDVKKKFPKVLKLDGVDLSTPILADVNEDLQITTIKGNYSRSEEGLRFVQHFLGEYYQLYDSDNREQLANCYLDNSMLSIKSTYPLVQSYTGSELVKYIPDSQNPVCEKNHSKRHKLLYRGNKDIISCLYTLPRTQHIGHLFLVYLTLFTPQVIMMTVKGLFLEQRPTGKQALRSFNRELVIVPHGKGYCAMHDELFVTSATDDQRKAAMLPLAPLPTPVPDEVSPQVAYPDVAVKQQMVEDLSAQTGMNMYWTKKCLDECNWDIHQAMFTFSEVSKRETIPAEAFAN